MLVYCMQPAAVSCLHAGLLQVCSARQTPITQTAVAEVSININSTCSLEQELRSTILVHQRYFVRPLRPELST